MHPLAGQQNTRFSLQRRPSKEIETSALQIGKKENVDFSKNQTLTALLAKLYMFHKLWHCFIIFGAEALLQNFRGWQELQCSHAAAESQDICQDGMPQQNLQ